MTEEPRRAERTQEPSWLTAKVDQRVQLLGDVVPLKVHVIPGLIMLTLSEPPEDASQAEADRWERTCDNCGTYCPDETLFYTGVCQREKDGKQVLVAFGSCPRCKDLP